MAEPAPTTGTEVPSNQGSAFPPFDTTTYSAQLFWLAVTFAILLVVMWRLGVKRLGGAIGERKGHIAGDLEAAEGHRRDAEKASADYEAALTAARNRAHALAGDNHKRVQAEIDSAKAKADADAQDATAKAEARIAALRTEAKGHVVNAARDAAAEIVARLTGETVSPEEAAAAVAGSGTR